MYSDSGCVEPIKLLLVEPDAATARCYLAQLARCGVAPDDVTIVPDADEACAQPKLAPWRLALLCCADSGSACRSAVRRFKKQFPETPVIMLSEQGSLTQAIEVMRDGADDFLIKPVSDAQFAAALKRAEATSPAPALAATHAPQNGAAKLIGSSRAMRELHETLVRAASSKATVFLKGESGTGKELCAEAVHALSPRGSGPLISLNCSAIPRELMESEIFGHEKGAFTGAAHRREGAAELADGGTLFLDEICEMDLALQAKLLRFIQTGQFMRVGGSQLKTVDVRFVCATNKEPMAAVQSGAFRADLFYRLHVLPIVLPALREREEDVLEIARHVLALYSAEEGKSFQTLGRDVERLLMNYWWPGNVRELLNTIRNVVVMNDGTTVTANMIPLALAQGAATELTTRASAAFETFGESGPVPKDEPGGAVLKPLWQHEQDIIERAIAACDGNIGKAAAHLDINASTIYRKRHHWAHQGAA